MATKFLSPKLLNTLPPFTRFLSSASTASIAAVSPLNFDEKPEPNDAEKQLTEPTTATTNLDLSDHQKLFASVSTLKLLRSSATLGLASNERFIDFGMWVMNSRLMETSLVRDAILKTVKHTFFQQFCAGETTEEAADCVRRVHDSGFRGMLVYAVEHTEDNAGCDRNLEGFIKSVELSKSLPPSSVSFVIAKITAICPIGLLRRVSDLLRWQYKDPSFNLPWKLNTLPIFSDSSALYHTLEKPAPLASQEELDLHLAHQRLLKLCQKCIQDNVPLTIDAEDTSIQPAIDYFTYSSAIMYNRDDKPIVYCTIQAYLKDARERLFMATKTAESLGIPMGFKLVRGAYMSSESNLASLLGYDSPIHNSIGETHACYNDCASFMLERIADGYGAVVLATHNIESGQLVASKACDLGIRKGNQKLEFAQLYGMSEALSFGLKNAGFQVSKYLPYGPVDMVVPYLLRRAEENRGLLSTSSLDRILMGKELMRRQKKLQFTKSKMASPSSIKVEIGTE
ncbi:Proline dehydrogenase 1 [Hibiscus syriacus]|uniref:Proline dehydrogenase n=1 Tax=Hibiscus syriacus TaxID=106335 RepID=A0A6A2Z1N4_HIBSY|nr:proline dehydrogenase 2, mitochondrial-like [Hibiscus syriacus]KAE8685453.1 Proline dehydrogenase 1 [Hibiscus syriacus]